KRDHGAATLLTRDPAAGRAPGGERTLAGVRAGRSRRSALDHALRPSAVLQARCRRRTARIGGSQSLPVGAALPSWRGRSGSLASEVATAVATLPRAALWRFTPPPRALATPATVSLHLHGDKAMAEIAIARAGAPPTHADLLILDGEFRPLAAKEVTLMLAN